MDKDKVIMSFVHGELTSNDLIDEAYSDIWTTCQAVQKQSGGLSLAIDESDLNDLKQDTKNLAGGHFRPYVKLGFTDDKKLTCRLKALGLEGNESGEEGHHGDVVCIQGFTNSKINSIVQLKKDGGLAYSY